jgi:hypothetical protein
MQRDRDDFCASHRLFPLQPGEMGIGSRAARTAL